MWQKKTPKLGGFFKPNRGKKKPPNLGVFFCHSKFPWINHQPPKNSNLTKFDWFCDKFGVSFSTVAKKNPHAFQLWQKKTPTLFNCGKKKPPRFSTVAKKNPQILGVFLASQLWQKKTPRFLLWQKKTPMGVFFCHSKIL